MSNPLDLYTTRMAAEKLGVTDSWIRRLILKGKLTARKIGNDWFITEKALSRLKLVRKNPENK